MSSFENLRMMYYGRQSNAVFLPNNFIYHLFIGNGKKDESGSDDWRNQEIKVEIDGWNDIQQIRDEKADQGKNCRKSANSVPDHFGRTENIETLLTVFFSGPVECSHLSVVKAVYGKIPDNRTVKHHGNDGKTQQKNPCDGKEGIVSVCHLGIKLNTVVFDVIHKKKQECNQQQNNSQHTETDFHCPDFD